MKKIFVCNCLVLIVLMAFVSCSKPDRPLRQSNLPYPSHPLAGQEMLFDSLAWQHEDDNTNIYILIDSPSLFMPFWKMDVSLKLVTSSTWTPVTISSGFAYHLSLPGKLVIYPSPSDTSMANYYTSVKIKFH